MDNFQTLFELLPIGAYRSSYAGHQLRANAALVRLNGYDSEQEMLLQIGDIATEWYCDPQRRVQFLALLRAQGRAIDFVSEVYRHKTRERIWIREHAHQVCDAHGQLLYIEGTVQEITQEHQAQRDLVASEKRFRAMTALSSDWYWELDVQSRFTRLDLGQHSHSTGVSQDVLGKTRQELTHIELSESQWRQYKQLLDAQRPFQDFEFPIRAEDGSLVWHAISGEPMVDDAGCFAGYRGIGRNITARKQADEIIRQLAFHDTLTGLANRRLFIDRLQQALAGMARGGQCGALMFLDLDKFKLLNDECGHEAGDVLLQQVAQRLKSCVRGIDTVARLGGDEFTVLLADVGPDAATATRHAQAVATKIAQLLALPFDMGQSCAPERCQISASVGLVILRDAALSPQACLNLADAAMYRAKSQGGKRVCCV
jgi:diguanylate cyclase (GGDEF)-like protein/PAS domain S-box-containing protein